MKDLPDDLMEPWQIIAIALYSIIVLPVVALYAAARAALTPAPRPLRVACGCCGYPMVALERSCPECRAAR